MDDIQMADRSFPVWTLWIFMPLWQLTEL